MVSERSTHACYPPPTRLAYPQGVGERCIVPLEEETQAIYALINATAVLGDACAPAVH